MKTCLQDYRPDLVCVVAVIDINSDKEALPSSHLSIISIHGSEGIGENSALESKLEETTPRVFSEPSLDYFRSLELVALLLVSPLYLLTDYILILNVVPISDQRLLQL